VNRDDIIRMAQQTGYTEAWITNTPNWLFIVKFAALVAAAEREACAKVAESYEPRCDVCPKGVANAIRARGET